MTNIHYWLANPTGNTTILIEDRFPASDYAKIAKALLDKEPMAEQAGFIEDITSHSVRLHMAGSEFCGNASLSAAALATRKANASNSVINVEVFGYPTPLQANIQYVAKDTYSGILQMPSPEDISLTSLSYARQDYRLPLVRFPGIGHLIATEPMDDSIAEYAIKSWCKELNLEALGIMLLDPGNHTLRPLVYVQEIDSLYWESSCASGTCATAAWLSLTNGIGRYDLMEPGGTLGAIVDNGMKLSLCGNVSLEEKQCS